MKPLFLIVLLVALASCTKQIEPAPTGFEAALTGKSFYLSEYFSLVADSAGWRKCDLFKELPRELQDGIFPGSAFEPVGNMVRFRSREYALYIYDESKFVLTEQRNDSAFYSVFKISIQ